MSKTVLILNGPNLNLLGTREPDIYGYDTLDDVKDACAAHAAGLGLSLDFRQSNHEGELVDWIQEGRLNHDGMIANMAGYSHTSVAILDALTAFEKPIVEVHLSNIFKREDFRHHSWVSGVANGVICGLGKQGYLLGLDALARLIPDNA